MSESTDVPEASKACTKCGVIKPLSDFSIDKRHADGRQSHCRECVKAYQKRWRQADREHYLELRRKEAKRSRDQQAAWRRANADRIREQARERRKAMTPEKLAAARAVHRAASTTYRLKNPELCNERIRAWAQANPDKASEGVNRRRAWKRGNGEPEKFTRTEIGDRDGWICGICELSIDRTLRFPDQQSPSLDHVIPLSLGGEHTRANSRIAHWICNVRRGARAA